VPGDNTHSWVFADRCHRFRVVWIRVFLSSLHHESTSDQR
jgi:hypothetical protein